MEGSCAGVCGDREADRANRAGLGADQNGFLRWFLGGGCATRSGSVFHRYRSRFGFLDNVNGSIDRARLGDENAG